VNRPPPRRAPRKQCVFCGARPVSKEHVFGKWLRTTVGQADHVVTKTQIADGPTKTAHPQVPFVAQVKVVCESCNNEWMSRVETAAMPHLERILNSQPVTLDEPTTCTLATWVFKTSLMVREQVRTDQPEIPPTQYRYLYEHREPPPQARIWLASLDEPLDSNVVAARAFAEHMAYNGPEIPDVLPSGTRFYGTSISIGPLMACVLGNIDTDFVPELVGGPADRMLPIWPYTRDQDWPPPAAVTPYGGFDGLHHMLFAQTP
jgi:hypothetical protein